jgi:hypothetical protein
MLGLYAGATNIQCSLFAQASVRSKSAEVKDLFGDLCHSFGTAIVATESYIAFLTGDIASWSFGPRTGAVV